MCEREIHTNKRLIKFVSSKSTTQTHVRFRDILNAGGKEGSRGMVGDGKKSGEKDDKENAKKNLAP